MFRLAATVIAFLAIVMAWMMYGVSNQFMPENDLYLEDCINCESNTMTEALFNKIAEAGKKAYASNAKANKETLIVNALWLDSTVNANCCRGCKAKTVEVNMFGGLARRPEITPEGFALVLAHELSHAYGGTPYYKNSDKMSGEGQADYMSTKEGYAKIAALVPELRVSISPDDFVLDTCSKAYGKFADARYSNCLHALEGGKSISNLLAVLSKEPAPDYKTPDTVPVNKTTTDYPKTVQCRMDTYLAGELLATRPNCWFIK